MLEEFIQKKRETKDILIMAHAVLGYPGFEENEKVLEIFSRYVDIFELQIPFSEPIADGPAITRANHIAVANEVTTDRCLDFLKKIIPKYPEKAFVLMTYYNILFTAGLEKFIREVKDLGVHGLIVPDLPPEEGKDYLHLCKKHGVNSIFIATPTQNVNRLRRIQKNSSGMVYAVLRAGVTGAETSFNEEALQVLDRYRKYINLPLAVGFGIQDRSAIEFLQGKADVAVIGSALLKSYDEGGADKMEGLLKSLTLSQKSSE